MNEREVVIGRPETGAAGAGLVVRTEGLSKRYPGPRGEAVRALDGLDLSFGPGEILALIGPNGAGKTTTIRILAGLLAPDSGTARIGETEIREDDPAVKRLVGWMPDFFGVYADLRAWEYLDLFAAAHGVPDRATRIDSLLARVGLAEKREARVGALSRGMIQRLCLARALVHDPPVLLLDEPASGLDPRARLDLRTLVRSLAEEGRAVLVSSHILAELEEMATHVAILERGRLVHAGAVGAAPTAETDRTYEVRLAAGAPAGAEALERLHAACPEARDARETPRGLALAAPATLPPERVLAALVAAGLPVVHFAEARDLEAIFLRTTKGETQ